MADIKAEEKEVRSTSIGDKLILLVHFTFTECRPILMFYASFKSYQALFMNYQVLHTGMITTEVEQSVRGPTNMTFSEYYVCATKDAAGLDMHFEAPYETECIGTIAHHIYGMPIKDNTILAVLNVLCGVVVIAFTIVMVTELIRSKVRGFGHGAYMAFTWRVENSLPHKICASVVIVFCGLLGVTFLKFLVGIIMKSGVMKALPELIAMVPSLGGLFGAAWHLMNPSDLPKIDFENPAFLNIQVKRPLSKVSQNNDAFFQVILSALHHHQAGLKNDLKALAPGDKYSDEDEMMKALVSVEKTTVSSSDEKKPLVTPSP